jgi:hypothetical protein
MQKSTSGANFKTWRNPRFFVKGTACETYLEYSGLWDPIKLNKHLGNSFLRNAINTYFDNKSRIAGDKLVTRIWSCRNGPD